jgi:hypothetical protein
LGLHCVKTVERRNFLWKGKEKPILIRAPLENLAGFPAEQSGAAFLTCLRYAWIAMAAAVQ